MNQKRLLFLAVIFGLLIAFVATANQNITKAGEDQLVFLPMVMKAESSQTPTPTPPPHPSPTPPPEPSPTATPQPSPTPSPEPCAPLEQAPNMPDGVCGDEAFNAGNTAMWTIETDDQTIMVAKVLPGFPHGYDPHAALYSTNPGSFFIPQGVTTTLDISGTWTIGPFDGVANCPSGFELIAGWNTGTCVSSEMHDASEGLPSHQFEIASPVTITWWLDDQEDWRHGWFNGVLVDQTNGDGCYELNLGEVTDIALEPGTYTVGADVGQCEPPPPPDPCFPLEQAPLMPSGVCGDDNMILANTAMWTISTTGQITMQIRILPGFPHGYDPHAALWTTEPGSYFIPQGVTTTLDISGTWTIGPFDGVANCSGGLELVPGWNTGLCVSPEVQSAGDGLPSYLLDITTTMTVSWWLDNLEDWRHGWYSGAELLNLTGNGCYQLDMGTVTEMVMEPGLWLVRPSTGFCGNFGRNSARIVEIHKP